MPRCSGRCPLRADLDAGTAFGRGPRLPAGARRHRGRAEGRRRPRPGTRPCSPSLFPGCPLPRSISPASCSPKSAPGARHSPPAHLEAAGLRHAPSSTDSAAPPAGFSGRRRRKSSAPAPLPSAATSQNISRKSGAAPSPNSPLITRATPRAANHCRHRPRPGRNPPPPKPWTQPWHRPGPNEFERRRQRRRRPATGLAKKQVYGRALELNRSIARGRFFEKRRPKNFVHRASFAKTSLPR